MDMNYKKAAYKCTGIEMMAMQLLSITALSHLHERRGINGLQQTVFFGEEYKR